MIDNLLEREKKKLTEHEIEKLTTLFDAADDNGDRFLTADELEQYLKREGIANVLLMIGTKLHSDPEVHFQSIIEDIKKRSRSFFMLSMHWN